LSLFGDLETRLKGEEFEIIDDLQRKIEELLGQVSSERM
jgi:hypothetical protein